MLKIGQHTFESHLFLGTGKFENFTVQKEAVEASGTNVLTFAVQRMNIFEPQQPNFLEQINVQDYTLLPNTAGAKNAEEAVRIAKLAQASGLCDMVKVEIIGCAKTLLPDPVETLRATEMLLAEGFTVSDFKQVIDNKCNDWLRDQKMKEYLRPETLFGTKFESYLNSKTTTTKQTGPYIDSCGLKVL